jgi:hypothetical protein
MRQETLETQRIESDGAGFTPGHAGPVYHPRGDAGNQLTQSRVRDPADARAGSTLAGGGARPGHIRRELTVMTGSKRVGA